MKERRFATHPGPLRTRKELADHTGLAVVATTREECQELMWTPPSAWCVPSEIEVLGFTTWWLETD
ncbi:MAG: hypothetical protein IPI82_15645 [Candidatus Microthrix sp.]|nr:hypothetical protein [Candidatus Microthrix sp.]MBK7323826.1 hypothetical protein [Candidatus Microthrix sp.]